MTRRTVLVSSATFAERAADALRFAMAVRPDLAHWISNAFTVVGSRIEPQDEKISDAYEQVYDLIDLLEELEFSCWREGTGILILGMNT